MMPQIRTLELIAWDLDSFNFRPSNFDAGRRSQAHEMVAQRASYQATSAFCDYETNMLRDMLDCQLRRSDLHAEMLDLDWSLGVVDLRCLIAFQRRLSLNSVASSLPIPTQNEWADLLSTAFGPPHPIVCDIRYDVAGKVVTLQSSNPNLHLRITKNPSAPITVHAGGPFFEVALYKGRWFLRDGYHRAYRLLQAGVFLLPAVIVRARSLQELGAVHPWFFPESILLSTRPPSVCDFLDSALTIEYVRPPIVRTLRITLEESTSPPPFPFTSGELI